MPCFPNYYLPGSIRRRLCKKEGMRRYVYQKGFPKRRGSYGKKFVNAIEFLKKLKLGKRFRITFIANKRKGKYSTCTWRLIARNNIGIMVTDNETFSPDMVFFHEYDFFDEDILRIEEVR
jgi:hypothetical protein